VAVRPGGDEAVEDRDHLGVDGQGDRGPPLVAVRVHGGHAEVDRPARTGRPRRFGGRLGGWFGGRSRCDGRRGGRAGGRRRRCRETGGPGGRGRDDGGDGGRDDGRDGPCAGRFGVRRAGGEVDGRRPPVARGAGRHLVHHVGARGHGQAEAGRARGDDRAVPAGRGADGRVSRGLADVRGRGAWVGPAWV